MRPINVAAVCVNQTPLDWDGNERNILSALAVARSGGATIVCFPEMAIPGYNCEDAFLSANTLEQSWRVLQQVLPETRGLVVAIGLPMLVSNALFNCAAVLVDGKIAGFVAKQHLAGDGIHYEPRWFRAWPAGVQSEVVIEGERYPIGDLYFDIGGVRIGFEICEDAWVASRPGSRLAAKGVDVILNPSASHFAFGKIETRKRFVLEGSRAFGVSYVYSNLLGNEAGARRCWCGSSASSASGRAISGSASDTRRRSTWTTRTSIRRRGAASRFSRADSRASCANYARHVDIVSL